MPNEEKKRCCHHDGGCEEHDCKCGGHHHCECEENDCKCGKHSDHEDACDCEQPYECDCEVVDDDDACECGCGCEHIQKPVPKQHIATPGFKPQNPDKGVSLGPELEREIADMMRKRYKRFLDDDETFEVKTEVCHHFGLVSSRMTNKSRTVCATAEVSVECEDNKIENPMDAYTKALDVLDLVWLDYFDSDRIAHYLPIWQGYEIDSMTVNVRFEHSNPALDDEATAFLKAHGLLENGLSPDDYRDDYDEEEEEE